MGEAQPGVQDSDVALEWDALVDDLEDDEGYVDDNEVELLSLDDM